MVRLVGLFWVLGDSMWLGCCGWEGGWDGVVGGGDLVLELLLVLFWRLFCF